jgi:GT2 family glycosyltransferase/glycosyltransferase involved in cell wall biosynthesis
MSAVTHEPSNESSFKQGNTAMRQGDSVNAVRHYLKAMEVAPGLAITIAANLAKAKQKYRADRNTADKPRVAVCGWDLSHNAAGRVYTLAMLYETFAEVEIIGCHFPSSGREIWEPIRDTAITKHSFVVEDESKFIEQAIQLVAAHPYDIVHLSKPRAPNIFFGMLYKLIWDAKVLMDIDDEELAFVGAETPISVEDYLKEHSKLPDLRDLTGKDWTQLAVGLVNEFDGITVCNTPLQQRYGGEIIRHARDEKLFKPSPELKRKNREKYGIPLDKKVVIFFGTPREHKGLIETAQALSDLNRKDTLYVIVGNFLDNKIKNKLIQIIGCEYKFIDNKPFAAIPEIIAIADICILQQDESSAVTQFQTPAKLSEALGMGLTVIASQKNIFHDLFQAGAVIDANGNLKEALKVVLEDKALRQKISIIAMKQFNHAYTVKVNSVELQSMVNFTYPKAVDSKSIFLDKIKSINVLFNAIKITGNLTKNYEIKVIDYVSDSLEKLNTSSGNNEIILSKEDDDLIKKMQGCDLNALMSIVSDSGYFDINYYLSEYLDVASNKKINPLSHFVRKGGSEKRNPSSRFDTAWYLRAYPEVLSAGINPLVHFIKIGNRNNFKPLDERQKLDTWWSGIFSRNSSELKFNAYKSIKRAAKNQAPVSILIPVYNALAELKVCVRSVLRNTRHSYRLILINDSSSDPAVQPYLDSLVGIKKVEVYSNQVNLGFTATINKGIELAGKSDVIFLNSDTCVTPNWMVNLRLAAYSSELVGSATPFSNNAGAYSAPRIGVENSIPQGYSLDEWARAIAHTSDRIYAKAPTGHGFCMYIRRDCLNDVGELDQKAFPRGYGEENDFCMRALRKGWQHVVDQSTYIYHVRSASFGSAKTDLLKQGRAIVDERYPEYTATVRSFLKQKDFVKVHDDISEILSILINTKISIKPRILYVLATKTGGTPQTNQDLMQALDPQVETFVLYSNSKKIDLCHYSNGVYCPVETYNLNNELCVFPHRSNEYDETIAEWLTKYSIEIVHIRHIAWHSLGLVDISKLIGLPVVFSFHDFYVVCPTVKLLDNENKYCGGICTATIGECKYDLWRGNENPPLKSAGIIEWRNSFDSLLLKCDAFVTTNESAKKVLIQSYPSLKNQIFPVIPHGRDFAKYNKISRNINSKETIKLLFPGNITRAKGGEIMMKLAAISSSLNIEIHILGNVSGDIDVSNCFLHGQYGREDFVEKVSSIAPHIACIFSIWPETHCHTLTESWASGLPVIGFNIGAVGDRLSKTKAGWLVDEFESAPILNLINQIRIDNNFYGQAVDAVIAWQLTDSPKESCVAMASAYMNIYNKLLG